MAATAVQNTQPANAAKQEIMGGQSSDSEAREATVPAITESLDRPE